MMNTSSEVREDDEEVSQNDMTCHFSPQVSFNLFINSEFFIYLSSYTMTNATLQVREG